MWYNFNVLQAPILYGCIIVVVVVYLDAGGGGVFLLFVLLSLHKPVTLLAQAVRQATMSCMYVCIPM